MSKFFWALDFGHGGLTPSGHYTTAPAKMHKFPDGFTVYEGVINRQVGARLMRKLRHGNIDYVQISDDVFDTSLESRVHRADVLFKTDKRLAYLAIHANAADDPNANGNEIWTSKGQTKSDKFAQVFCAKYQELMPRMKFRKDEADGDWDKEADFYVLRKTDCPSMLVENGFFTNRNEAEWMSSEAGQELYAEAMFQAIKECENLSI
jgi:N-acetylmuramoyl-L-alanine amidase